MHANTAGDTGTPTPADLDRLLRAGATAPATGTISVPCSQCWAQPGQPCTGTSLTGRVSLTWFHSARESLALTLPTSQDRTRPAVRERSAVSDAVGGQDAALVRS